MDQLFGSSSSGGSSVVSQSGDELGEELPTMAEVVKQFFRFFLLNYQLIPVSLCVVVVVAAAAAAAAAAVCVHSSSTSPAPQ